MNYFFSHLIHSFHLPLRNPVLIFSLLLFIILMSPIILRKLKIPAIIGLIISGVIIGPKGLNLIGEKLLESDGSVKLFSTIGLLYIMFMAGLELDMNEFKKYRNKSITFGFLTFIIPLSLGFPLCYYGLKLDFMASLITASMFSTHTLVTYPIVSKFGLTKKRTVAITVGGTILTDTAVLIILAIITGSVKGELGKDFWLRMITSFTIFIMIMFWIIPRVSRWFLSKLESEKTAHYIFILSVIFFSAFLAEMAGMEHIIGAFVAGLALNKLIPNSSPLMNRIDFIGNALFIPFFLISVGMVVNIQVLFNGYWSLIIAIVLTVFALFSKWLAALLMQIIYKMKSTERQLIFGLSSAHAAATLAIIFVGFENNIIGIDVVNGTVILIILTCLISSFITENASRKYLLNNIDDEQITAPLKRNQHLLIATNELKGNENLIDFSILITDKKVINPISVVSVLQNDEEAERRIRASRNHMEEIVKHYSGGEIKVNPIATIDNNISGGIARTSKELAADIVVLNDSKQENILMRIVGDERERLIELCSKTIFFCKIDRPFVEKKRIVIYCPPYSDLENSFTNWLERIIRLGLQLNLQIVVFSNNYVGEKIKLYLKHIKSNIETSFNLIKNLDDVFLKNIKIYKSDLLVLCSSRKGSVSYSNETDIFLSKMQKAYGKNDYILIYPSQEISEKIYSNYDDMSSEALQKGMETIQKITKEVGSIFQK